MVVVLVQVNFLTTCARKCKIKKHVYREGVRGIDNRMHANKTFLSRQRQTISWKSSATNEMHTVAFKTTQIICMKD